jgi:hypothetical protein
MLFQWGILMPQPGGALPGDSGTWVLAGTCEGYMLWEVWAKKEISVRRKP